MTIRSIPQKVGMFPQGVKEEIRGNLGKMVQFETVGRLEGKKRLPDNLRDRKRGRSSEVVKTGLLGGSLKERCWGIQGISLRNEEEGKARVIGMDAAGDRQRNEGKEVRGVI